MPPFGPLFRQRVFVDDTLTAGDMVFNGGTHTNAICMRYDDFDALVHPIVGRIAQRPLEAEGAPSPPSSGASPHSRD